MGKRLWDLAKSRFEIATILLGHRYIVSLCRFVLCNDLPQRSRVALSPSPMRLAAALIYLSSVARVAAIGYGFPSVKSIALAQRRRRRNDESEPLWLREGSEH